MKYSECLAEWLVEFGYTHCFYVGGGNIMHLLESFSMRLDCRAVIHEVAAGIAAEYFNETSRSARALALVTAGPGLTNIVTAIAGAHLESRELLVIGGQVKTTDLATGNLRQRGIQEINGVSIVKGISKASKLLDSPISKSEFQNLVALNRTPRKGPVFIEIPLDVQSSRYHISNEPCSEFQEMGIRRACTREVKAVTEKIKNAKRPLFLLGGGINRDLNNSLELCLEHTGIPVATTWNAADRIGSRSPIYVGRPNTWGQRSANLILQQADLLIALGTRLGMQQTGFNWKQFVPGGQVIHVDVDPAELEKGHPRVDLAICADANDFLGCLCKEHLGDHKEWLAYARYIREELPLVEDINTTASDCISPYEFTKQLSGLCNETDIIIPCSSGGAFTVMMQTFEQQLGQLIVTNKGLASMGYGLSGAIGAAVANPERRTLLVEGDGGFAQNMQEVGTAALNNLNLKIFIFDDSGYSSIRATQRNYFGGRYVGCDISTGLGLPNWERLFSAWGVSTQRLKHGYHNDKLFLENFNSKGLFAFIVSLDPEQSYFPKIASRLTESGSMESNPLHMMSPQLPDDVMERVAVFIKHS